MMIRGLYTAAPGCDVLKYIAMSLADVTKGDMDSLRSCLILLPTRRAIRVLEEKLLEAFQLPTVLLPQIMALGDIELPPEDEDSGHMPPRNISGLERIISLLPYLEKYGLGGKYFDGQWRMAGEVARLIDMLQTEDLEIDAIGTMINAADLALHWQNNGGLFERVAREWLVDKKAQKRINAAAGRTLRIETLIEQWRAKPPENPVWLVGSTGSIPAVRRLMKETLSLPQGAVLLPGVDMLMNDAEWAAMSDSHPQAILRNTINSLKYDRREIKIWPYCEINPAVENRSRWLSDALSPFPRNISDPQDERVTILAADTQQEEAEGIATYCLNHFKRTPDKSISIIANDPALTRRLLPLLSAYGINLDPSAGLALQYTGLGQAIVTFLRVLDVSTPLIELWSLLKRADFVPYWPLPNRDKILEKIEKDYLRDPLKIPETVDDLLALFPDNALSALRNDRIGISGYKSLSSWASIVRDIVPVHFSTLFSEDRAVMECVIECLDNISSLQTSHVISYDQALVPICEQILRLSVRKSYLNSHTVQILGTMEARLIHADVVIMAGLNEGIWPDAPQPSPFLSRGMRHKIGLPDTERHAALAGHDFQQAFLMPEIVITYAHRSSEQPMLPARWLLRLEAITDKNVWNTFIARGNDIIGQRKRINASKEFIPALPPAPLANENDVKFPLYVTQMETWRNDPYSFWAKHIARLRKLDKFMGDVDASTRGTLWHKIFRLFAEKFDKNATLSQQNDMFRKCIEDVFVTHEVPLHKQRIWRNRLASLSDVYITYENNRRSFSTPIGLEKEWEGQIGAYSFKAKADRVDITHGDTLLLLDYKTGAPPTKADIDNGYACQLSLLALLMDKPVYEIEYLAIKGGREPIDSQLKIWTEEFSDTTRKGVISWIKLFLEHNQAFVSLADLRKQKNRDYLHLSRHNEWGMEA